MTEQAIVRKQIIVVNEIGTNTYDDLIFTDKEGGQYKIGVKRKPYFDKIIIPGMAVQLNYAEAYGKEYIYSAIQVKDALPEPVKPLPLPTPGLPTKEEPKPVMTKDVWAEKDRITRKSIERQTSLNAAIEIAKLMGADKITTDKIIATAKLFEAYLEDKEVQLVKSRLVEEAKRLGAKEIPEEEVN